MVTTTERLSFEQSEELINALPHDFLALSINRYGNDH